MGEGAVALTGFGVGPGFGSGLYHILQPWVNYLSLLNPNFPLCKMGIIIVCNDMIKHLAPAWVYLMYIDQLLLLQNYLWSQPLGVMDGFRAEGIGEHGVIMSLGAGPFVLLTGLLMAITTWASLVLVSWQQQSPWCSCQPGAVSGCLGSVSQSELALFPVIQEQVMGTHSFTSALQGSRPFGWLSLFLGDFLKQLPSLALPLADKEVTVLYNHRLLSDNEEFYQSGVYIFLLHIK